MERDERASALLFTSDIGDALHGLAIRIEHATRGSNPGSARRMYEVYERFKPYTSANLPPGSDVQLVRLLIVSAGLGLWDAMDAQDIRMGEALIAYYGSDASTLDLVGLLGVGNEGTAGDLLRRGLTFLWEQLPEPGDDFPLDKHAEFPPAAIHASRRRRARLLAQARYRANGDRLGATKDVSPRTGQVHAPDAAAYFTDQSQTAE
jgi:hypothetical protein